MKKLLLLLVTVMVISALVLGSCGKPESTETTTPTDTTKPTETTKPSETTPSGDTIELKFSYHTPPQASLVGTFFQPWTDSIEEATGGRVKITHYPSATLVSLTDQYDAVVSGLADMAMVEADITPGRFPLTEFNLLPLLFPDGPVAARVTYEVLEKYAFDTEWSEVKVLMVPALAPMNYHGTKPLETLEDFKGLRVRSGGKVEGWILEELGATPVEMETGDLSTSLERGMLDGAFLSDSAVLSFGVRDVTQYRTECGLFSRVWVIVMNLQTWESLPDDIKKAFEDNSGAEASAQFCIENDKSTKAVGRGLNAYDAQVGNPGYYALPEEEKDKWVEAILPVWERWIDSVEDKGLPGQELLDDVVRLVDEYKDLYKPEETTQPTGPTVESLPTLKSGQIYWDAAADYAGQTVAVYGPVLGIEDLSDKAGKKKLLMGTEDGAFQVDIANAVESKFPLLDGYIGKNIYVTGEVTLNAFAGVYEVIITDPSAIEVVVNWDEVADYAGQTVTVRGQVFGIEDLSDKASKKKLLMGTEDGAFQVDIANAVESKFPPLDGYVGEYIYVTGEVTLNAFAGVYEVIITDPTAIIMGVSQRVALKSGSIYWDEAADYAGQTAAVYGPVLGIEDLSDKAGKKKLLMGTEDGAFQVDIANAVESKFPPLDGYIGKNIYVTGEVTLNAFAGVYEVIITDPSAIEVVVNWDEVADYAGQTVTVRGQVFGIEDLSDKASKKKLLMGTEDGAFQVDIANAVESKFPPLDDYVGEYIYVTGEIVLNAFAGVYEVVITDPSAIAVAE